MSPFDPSQLTGTPYLAPLVPTFPVRMRRTEILTIVYRTDPAAADRVIPEPLRLTGDLVVVHVYWMHDSEWFGVYGESACPVPVELPDGARAVYSPFLVLGSDGAVAAGRELYGQPKKEGEVSSGRAETCSSDVSPQRDRHRDRDDVLQAGRGRGGRPRAPRARVGDQRQPARVAEDEACFDASSSRANSRTSSCTSAGAGPRPLELRPNAQVPVYLMPVGEVVLGLHRMVDLSLAPGRRTTATGLDSFLRERRHWLTWMSIRVERGRLSDGADGAFAPSGVHRARHPR